MESIDLFLQINLLAIHKHLESEICIFFNFLKFSIYILLTLFLHIKVKKIKEC